MQNIQQEVPDLVVVGAGITGLSIAWHALEAGMRHVVVLDRAGVGAEASGVQPGGVRRQWSTAINCALATEAIEFFHSLGDRLGLEQPPVLEECGYLFVAHSEETLAGLRDDVALQRRLGIPSQLLSAQEIAELVPGFEQDGALGGSYCAEDGYVDRPQAVVEGFADAVLRRGGSIESAEVRGLERDGDGWLLDLGRDGSRAAASVVVAAGTGTPQLLAPVGLDVPIVPQAKYLFYSEPIEERLLEPLVVLVDRRFAAKQLASGRVLASDLAAAGAPDDASGEWRRTVRACIESTLPHLTYVSFGLLVGGFYDTTPDHQAVVAPVSDDGTLWVAAGFSGHGFMLAPAIGRLVVDGLEGRADEALLAELSPARFERGAVHAEARVV